MQLRKHSFLIPMLLGVGVLLAGLLLLWPASSANAQCGSQASSCKNCHETQGKDPVNTDGTGWHESHAFGDFCYLCHAGNNQSMDEAEAHAGMVPPLSDTEAACQSCHPADLDARVQVYATALGIEPGSGGTTSGSEPPAATSGGEAAGDAAASDAAASDAAASDAAADDAAADDSAETGAAPGMVVDSSQEVIDYNQRYDEVALGKRPVNWGNVIVSVMIVMLAVGGGAFVFWNERKLRGIKTNLGRPKAAVSPAAPVRLEDYSPEVLALLPRLAQLDPVGLHALKRLLENPEQASTLLSSLSHLDPELVRRIRSLDRDARALLLALAGI